MLIKDKLSRISLQSLIPSKKTPPVITTEEPLSSSPFVMPKNTKLDAPFTGRVKELDLLRSLYREFISTKSSSGSPKGDHGKPLVIGIKGEAGIGKSRLATEFQKNISASQHGKNFIYRSGCVSSGQEAYGLFRGFFSETNFLKQTATEERRTLIQNRISENILSQAREATKNNLPIVILLEDMQWADELSLAALDHLLNAANLSASEEGLLLILLLNFRPSFRPGRVIRRQCRLVEIELKGFSESESKQFISKLTGSKKISTNTIELINRRSEGNPFNIEEICRSLEDGSKQIKIPATVKGLLVDKVSQLEKDERAVLIIASVLGRKFSLKLLNAILKKADKRSAGADVMSRLEEKKYLVNLTSDVYEFRHDLLHEMIYRQLNKELRKNVHALAAASIEEIYSANLSSHYYELVRHYEAAGDESNTIKYLEKAGDKARDNYENDRAERFYKKLLRLESNSENKISIQLKLCDVYMNRDQWDKQIEICEQLLKKNRGLKSNIRIECLKRIGYCYRLKGEYKQALKYYKKSMRIANAKGDLKSKLDLMEHEAKVMLSEGKHEEALKSFELIYNISKKHDFIETYTNSLIGLGIGYNKVQKFSHSIRFNRELITFGMSIGNKQFVCTGIINTAEAYYLNGDYKKARENYVRALQLSKENGNIKDCTNCLGNLGIIHFTLNNHKKALCFFLNQLKGYEKLGDNAGRVRALGHVGACYIVLHDYEKALNYLEIQYRLSVKFCYMGQRSLCLGNLGIVYGLLGYFSKAQELFEEQLKIDKACRNKFGVFRAKVNMAIQCKNLNDFERAKRYLTGAMKIAREHQISNISLCSYNLAEVLNKLKKYGSAIKAAKAAQEEAKKVNNKILRLKCEILMEAIDIVVKLNKWDSTTQKRTNLIHDHYMRILKKVTRNSKIEERALVWYHIWWFRKQYGFSLNNRTDTAGFLALKLYQNLFNKYRHFEYLSKIKELKSQI